ncbi:MAG TPA: lysophospholipid acyltransferase family protein [Chloroflexota bacterium]
MAWLRIPAARPVAAGVQPGLLIDDTRARLQVAALEALSVATSRIPRAAVEPICRVVGSVWFAAAPAARAAVRANLYHVLGHAPSTSLVHAVFVSGALNYWDVLALRHMSRAQLTRLVSIRGREHIDAALAAGHGVILAGAHLSSVSLVGQIMLALGYTMVSMVEPIEPRRVFDFFASSRAGFGLRVLPVSAAALRELLGALRRNEMVGVITDRDITGSGPFVDFFDAPTRFPDGLPALSVRTGAPILPSIAVRLPNGTFVAVIEPPLAIPHTGDKKRDVLLLTQAMAGRLQYHVANHPEQWTVFQPRWPAGAARE